MGKKRELQGAVVQIDLPVDVPVPEPKKKRDLSEAQRANLSKGMAILKAKREAKAASAVPETTEVPEPKQETKPVPVVAPVVASPPVVKERKQRPQKNYLSTEDFNSFKSELFNTLKTTKQDVPMPVVQPPVVQQTIVQPIKERVFSGRELLDKIFNF